MEAADIRQHWTLGCFGFCHRHKQPIKRGCPSCKDTLSLGFTKIQGVWELVCHRCSYMQRAALSRKDIGSNREKGVGSNYIKRAHSLIIDFERSLFKALTGKTPSPRWMGNATPTEFVKTTENLIELLISDFAPRNRLVNAINFEAFPAPRLQDIEGDVSVGLAYHKPMVRRFTIAALVAMLCNNHENAFLRHSISSHRRCIESPQHPAKPVL